VWTLCIKAPAQAGIEFNPASGEKGMYRVCAVGAFLLAVLALGSGCGSNVTSAALAPGNYSVQASQGEANRETSLLGLQFCGPLPVSSKWYADQD
jgi:hypothetical protein